MSENWKMKPIHRLIVTSRAYRMASTSDSHDATIDPDNTYLWRMASKRMEAEVVRDNILYVSGSLEETIGGPEVDHLKGLQSHRRSIYLRTAAEKQVEFLSIFDGPSVTECYARKPSVMPQQALALANSEIAINQAQMLADKLSSKSVISDEAFVSAAFVQVLARKPGMKEKRLCLDFLAQTSVGTKDAALRPVAALNAQAGSSLDSAAQRRRMNLILVLFNHNDFVTIR